MNIFKQGKAAAILFPILMDGIEDVEVTIYENGIVHFKTDNEETTTHLNHCEVLWTINEDSSTHKAKLYNIKPPNDAS